jgi:hypothetical protein
MAAGYPRDVPYRGYGKVAVPELQPSDEPLRIVVFSKIIARVSQDHAPLRARKLEEANVRGGGILGVIVLVWLLIGVVAAYQRDYFDTAANSCGTAGTIALTVLSGPLNYAGANPKVADCKLPEPSQ